MSQVRQTRPWVPPHTQPGRPWQFSLRALFLMLGLSGFPLTLVSPPFFAAWSRHANLLDRFERQTILVFYAISLTFIAAVLFCYVAEVLNKPNWQSRAQNRGDKRPYSHRFAIDYTITAIATPLLFVLAPLDFLRTPIIALKLFVAVFTCVSVGGMPVRWLWRRVKDSAEARREETGDAPTSGKGHEIKVRYKLTSADVRAATKAASRFWEIKPVRFSIVPWSLAAALGIALLIGSVLWTVLGIAAFGAASFLILLLRQRNQPGDLGHVQLCISAERFVTNTKSGLRYRRWNSLVGYEATRRYLFVFLLEPGHGQDIGRCVFVIPRRTLAPHKQAQVEAILRDQLSG